MFSNRISAACSTINRELQNIHRLKTQLLEYKNQEGIHVQNFLLINCIIVPREVKFMTDRLKVKDEQNEIVSDWKFAAMVIDRSLSKASIFTNIHFHFHLHSLTFTLTYIHFHLHSLSLSLSLTFTHICFFQSVLDHFHNVHRDNNSRYLALSALHYGRIISINGHTSQIRTDQEKNP